MPSTWTDRYYHYDTLGNAVMETDHKDEVVAFVDMEAFGNVVAGGTGGPRLTTKWNDPDSGMYYFNARWYDASTAAFIQVDSVKNQAQNRYTQSYSNPIRYVDPDGRTPVAISYRDPKTFDSFCNPRADGLLPNGKPIPPPGAQCDGKVPPSNPGAGICERWAIGVGGKQGVSPFQYPGGHGGTTVHPDRLPSPKEGAIVKWRGDAHWGVVAGGCLINCLGGYIRHHSPYAGYDGTVEPVLDGPVIYNW